MNRSPAAAPKAVTPAQAFIDKLKSPQAADIVENIRSFVASVHRVDVQVC